MGGTRDEVYSYAFNVDAAAESDLRRAPKEKLLDPTSATDEEKRARSAKVLFFSPGDSFEGFKNRERDASESPWLYLLFLILLVVEQALAVHLSFHLKGGEGSTAPANPQPVLA